MNFRERYRSMNESVAPEDALISATLARMEGAPRPRRAGRTVKLVLVVAAALACVTTALAANGETVLRVLYQLAPGMAEYMQPVNLVCEDEGVQLEVISADREGSAAVVSSGTGSSSAGKRGSSISSIWAQPVSRDRVSAKAAARAVIRFIGAPSGR